MKPAHDLKTHPQPFNDVKKGIKTFEFRYNDRNFLVGDTLRLHEYNPATETYSGDIVCCEVIHMISEGYGIPEKFCIMSIRKFDEFGRFDNLH